MSYKFGQQLIFIAMICTAMSLTSCGGGNPSSNGGSSTGQSSPAASPKNDFEDRLEFIRKGQFTYVWVFSRKDGKPIDKEDSAFLRTNAPQIVDVVLTDDGRRAVAGTNFDLAKGNLELLKKRFVVEDYSGK